MTGDRSTYLRVQQYYGEMLADFHRKQADIAADQASKLAAWRRQCRPAEPPEDAATEDEATGDEENAAAFDEEDFSNNTWLR